VVSISTGRAPTFRPRRFFFSLFSAIPSVVWRQPGLSPFGRFRGTGVPVFSVCFGSGVLTFRSTGSLNVSDMLTAHRDSIKAGLLPAPLYMIASPLGPLPSGRLAGMISVMDFFVLRFLPLLCRPLVHRVLLCSLASHPLTPLISFSPLFHLFRKRVLPRRLSMWLHQDSLGPFKTGLQ